MEDFRSVMVRPLESRQVVQELADGARGDGRCKCNYRGVVSSQFRYVSFSREASGLRWIEFRKLLSADSLLGNPVPTE
jgi:hypothetical protein